MGSPEHKQYIWNLISKIGTAMLTTRSGKQLRARPMQLVQKDYDGTLWFYTPKDDEKVEEINEDPQVCLTFTDEAQNLYVSLSGKAKLKTDQELIDRYWSPAVAAWFPEGKESETCAMIEIKINNGEHWKNNTSQIGYAYEIVKANLMNEKPDVGENKEF